MAKASDDNLPDGVTHVGFKQYDLKSSYSAGDVYMDQDGVCAGLCADYYRFYKKRATASIYKAENISQVSFLYKSSLRKYLPQGDQSFAQQSSKPTDPIQKKDSFARRIQFYQLLFSDNTTHPIKEGQIQDISLKDLFEDRNYLDISLSGFGVSHAITAIKLYNENGEFLEYRLFDPNRGEYHNIKTVKDLDSCLKLVLAKYDKNKYTSYEISDYEDLFKSKGYDLVKNKKIFRFLDEIRNTTLSQEELKGMLAELPLEAKDYIGSLLPNNPQEMKRILRLAPDEILSSGSAVYSVLEFALRNHDEDIKNLILNNSKYLNIAGGAHNDTALNLARAQNSKESKEIERLILDKINPPPPLHQAVLDNDFKKVQELVLKSDIDINAVSHAGNTALHIAARKGQCKIIRVLLKAGADITKENPDGKTALDVAKGDAKITLDTARFLKENGELALAKNQSQEQSGPQKRKASPGSYQSKRRGSEMHKRSNITY